MLTPEQIVEFHWWKLNDWNRIHGQQLKGLLKQAMEEGVKQGLAEAEELIRVKARDLNIISNIIQDLIKEKDGLLKEIPQT